jgi:hypothetical protein
MVVAKAESFVAKDRGAQVRAASLVTRLVRSKVADEVQDERPGKDGTNELHQLHLLEVSPGLARSQPRHRVAHRQGGGGDPASRRGGLCAQYAVAGQTRPTTGGVESPQGAAALDTI